MHFENTHCNALKNISLVNKFHNVFETEWSTSTIRLNRNFLSLCELHTDYICVMCVRF